MKSSIFKYLNIGETEKNWGIYVTTVGHAKVTPNEFYPNVVHPQSHKLNWSMGRTLNDYYLVFISKGKGVFCTSKTNVMEIEEGNCFFLFPGVWHRYKPNTNCGWEEYWIGFNGYYIDQLMDHNFFSPSQPCVEIGLDKELLILLQKVIDVVQASFIGYSQQIAGLTLQILGYINTLSKSNQFDNNPIEKSITKAKFLLQESLSDTVDMPKIAREIPMSYSAFRKNFKAVTGLSPHQYRLNLRIERAKELLESTLLNVEEIAEATGFDGIYYFSKIFKKKAGMSPNAYRKSFF